MTGEGSLQAPTRENIKWQDPDFADEAKLDAEMRRVFDICHGCRRCFNLCDSFPRLFDLIDSSPKEDVEHLASRDFKPIVEACTLCDMCFMTKCPYVPPHPFMLDFPHLMLRHRFVEAKKGNTEFIQRHAIFSYGFKKPLDLVRFKISAFFHRKLRSKGFLHRIRSQNLKNFNRIAEHLVKNIVDMQLHLLASPKFSARLST